MIIFVDGDNSPGTKTDKADELDAKDILTVVYAAKNNYYKSEKNRQKLVLASGCTVSFREVEAGNNAADLAIAMDAARTAEERQRGIMVLVSDDNHIRTIASQLQKEYPDMLIAQARTLGEAVDAYKILEVSSLQELQQRLEGMFGKRYGSAFYLKLRQLYLPERAVVPAANMTVKRPAVRRFVSSTVSAVLAGRILRKGKVLYRPIGRR